MPLFNYQAVKEVDCRQARRRHRQLGATRHFIANKRVAEFISNQREVTIIAMESPH